jgi:hypothetical protein
MMVGATVRDVEPRKIVERQWRIVAASVEEKSFREGGQEGVWRADSSCDCGGEREIETTTHLVGRTKG